MSKSYPQVLVIAPGHGGRGGIDSVVRLHGCTDLWQDTCSMLSTYDDRGACYKIWAALRAYITAPLAIARAQIVHIHLAGETSFLRKLPLLGLSAALGKPIILHVHAHGEESLFRKTPHWAWRFAFRKAQRVIALSPSWAAIIRRHTQHPGVVVVPNPVKRFPPAARDAGLPPRILYVGKLELRKGFDTLIAAAAIVLRSRPDAEFWFSGHGDLPGAEALARTLGISDRVHLLGWLNSEQLEEIYDLAHIFCLPSHNEGVPMSVLEAMSHGLPVVCTPVGGIPDVVAHEFNGLFVTPGDVKGVAAAILRLLQQPGLASSLASSGRSTVQAICSIDVVTGQLKTIYQELTANVSKGAIGVLHGS